MVSSVSPETEHTPAPRPTGVKGAGATGGPGCGARGRRHGLGGLRDNGPSNTSVTRPHRCEGQRRAWRARAAVPVSGGGAWPDVETIHRAGAAGVKGAGGTGGPGRGAGGRRQGQGGPRDRPLRAVRLACGDLAGGPPPTSTHSGQAHRQTIRRPEHQRRQSGLRVKMCVRNRGFSRIDL